MCVACPKQLLEWTIHLAPFSERGAESAENAVGVYVDGHRDVDDDEIGRGRNYGSKILGDAGSSGAQGG